MNFSTYRRELKTIVQLFVKVTLNHAHTITSLVAIGHAPLASDVTDIPVIRNEMTECQGWSLIGRSWFWSFIDIFFPRLEVQLCS